MDASRVRLVSVFCRKSVFLIQPYYRTTTGVLVGGTPITMLESSASDRELGEALLSTLECFKRGVPHPVDWEQVAQPLYESVGVKGWSSFIRGTRSCEVAHDGVDLLFTPMRNAGVRNGFQFLKESSSTIPAAATTDEIGNALRSAIERAE